jgi:hypothetical protein
MYLEKKLFDQDSWNDKYYINELIISAFYDICQKKNLIQIR